MKKRFFALTIVFAMIACFHGCTVADYEPTSQVTTSIVGETYAGCPLEGEHEQYYTMDNQLLVAQSDCDDIKRNSTITVTFKGSQGPRRMLIEVQYRENGVVDWSEFGVAYLELNESQEYDVPAGHELEIYATACAGQSGDVVLQIEIN